MLDDIIVVLAQGSMWAVDVVVHTWLIHYRTGNRKSGEG